jgi:hypothetical protein
LVECVEVDRAQYKRAVAVFTVAGIDIADWMVRNGHALDWPKYSKGDYAAAQDEAKRAESGMWSGSFVEPWRYRACRRAGHLIAVLIRKRISSEASSQAADRKCCHMPQQGPASSYST